MVELIISLTGFFITLALRDIYSILKQIKEKL